MPEGLVSLVMRQFWPGALSSLWGVSGFGGPGKQHKCGLCFLNRDFEVPASRAKLLLGVEQILNEYIVDFGRVPCLGPGRRGGEERRGGWYGSSSFGRPGIETMLERGGVQKRAVAAIAPTIVFTSIH